MTAQTMMVDGINFSVDKTVDYTKPKVNASGGQDRCLKTCFLTEMLIFGGGSPKC